jgi:hypothetical protein
MTENRSTSPINLERPNGHGGHDSGSLQTGDAWSFGGPDRIFAPLNPRASLDSSAHRSSAANSTERPTDGPRRQLDLSDVRPLSLKRPAFGKRGFAPAYQWEGVVEEINGTGFRARLVPYEEGEANAGKVEYADFDYDDLADESDVQLVEEGAIFYWTVGKSRNLAGTLTNTSLLRFRRVLPATAYQARRALLEAGELLRELGEEKST